MTTVYRIKLKNKDLKELKKLGLDEWLFETQEAAECTINALNAMLAEGKTLNWECSIVNVMSKEDAFAQFLQFAGEFGE